MDDHIRQLGNALLLAYYAYRNGYFPPLEDK